MINTVSFFIAGSVLNFSLFPFSPPHLLVYEDALGIPILFVYSIFLVGLCAHWNHAKSKILQMNISFVQNSFEICDEYEKGIMHKAHLLPATTFHFSSFVCVCAVYIDSCSIYLHRMNYYVKMLNFL